MGQSQQRAENLQNRLNNFNGNHQYNGPVRISSIVDCERLKRNLDGEMQQMENERQNMEGLSNNASDDAQNGINDSYPLEREIDDATSDASGAIRHASGINGRFRAEVAEQERRNELARKKEEERKKLACIAVCREYSRQILEEQRAEIGEEKINQLLGLLDQGREYAQAEMEGNVPEELGENKNKIIEAYNILKDMSNAEDMSPVERFDALSNIMSAAGSMLDDVSNSATFAGTALGTSLSAYAAGIVVYAQLASIFSEALSALEDLLVNRKAEIINNTLDRRLRMFDNCLCDNNIDLTRYPNIDSYIESLWDQVKPDDLFRITGDTGGDNNKVIEAVKSYFFTEAKARMLNCCLRQSVTECTSMLERAAQELDDN